MAGYGLIDAEGWMVGVVISDIGFNPKDYPCDRHIELTDEEAQKLSHSHLTVFHNGKKLCQIKDPKEMVKRFRAAGIPSQLYSHELKRHQEHLNPNYPEVGIDIPNPVPDKKRFEPTFDTEFKPGLKICSCNENDIDLLESQMIASGLYTKENAWQLAFQWLHDPMNWVVKTVWKGKIIQFEIYILNQGSNNVTALYNDHIDRARPLWFWKQVALPTLKSLYSYGFENINSQVRIDKPNYVKFLTEAYGHEVLRKTADSFVMRLNIKEAIKNIGDWRARKTMGADWKFEKGGVVVREMTDADLPALYTAIDTDWGDRTRKQLVLSRLNDSWELDSASVLLGFKDGKIINAHVYRERQDPTVTLMLSLTRGVTTQAAKAILGDKFKDQEAVLGGFKVWMLGVGYKVSSFIIETKLYNPNAADWAKRGFVLFSQDDSLSEVRMVL